MPPALLAEWQGLLRVAAVARGMERTPNKSQHTKLTPEKKILPPLLSRFELATFDYESGALTNKLSRLPKKVTTSKYKTHKHRSVHLRTVPVIPYFKAGVGRYSDSCCFLIPNTLSPRSLDDGEGLSKQTNQSKNRMENLCRSVKGKPATTKWSYPNHQLILCVCVLTRIRFREQRLDPDWVQGHNVTRLQTIRTLKILLFESRTNEKIY